MELTSKYMDIKGEVVKRIHNPEQVGKTGRKYRINYLVLKWTTYGKDDKAYVDYLPIKVFEAKRMADVRAGYIVIVPIKYGCSIQTEEVDTDTRESNGVFVTKPKLWPDFLLTGDVQIVDGSKNYEGVQEHNQAFKEEVVNQLPPDDDDLPF